MKKVLGVLFTLLLAVSLLTGCSSESKEESKTCTLPINVGISAEMKVKMSGEDDELKKISMEVSVSLSEALKYSGLDESAYDALSDEEKESVTKMMEDAMASQYEGLNGVKVSSKIADDNIVVDAEVDLNEADSEALTSLGFGEEDFKDASISDMVKDLESIGATCK